MQDETLVSFGGALKALDDKGKVGGYLVMFGGPESTDASAHRDYFTPETDFGLDVTTKARLLYNHGLDPELKARSLGVGSLKADKVGVWVEGQLSLRDEYEREIFGLVKAGKLGLSSGTASHLIRREKQANGSNKIVSWPLGLDASLTPTPAEPRTACVALKSLPAGSLKGEFLGPFAEVGAIMAAMRSLQDRAASNAFDCLSDEKAPAGDRLARIGGILTELRDTSLAMIRPLLVAEAPAEGDGAAKSLPPTDQFLLDQFLQIEARLAGVPV